jgi:hypothetical protein
MIKQILEMLGAFEHYNQSEVIEIAKGKYELSNTFIKGIKQIKRNYKWQSQ